MKTIQELQQELFMTKARAKQLIEKEGTTKDECDAINQEMQTIKAKIKIAEGLEDSQAQPGKQLNPKKDDIVDTNARYEKAFVNSLNGKATRDDIEILTEARAALGSEIAQDGGYLVPVNQETQINELKREMTSLRDLVRVEEVTTLSGSRVLEKDAEHTPFGAIGENTGIGATNNPQFDPVDYKIKKYGGILPIPNELLSDAGSRLRGYLNRWLAKKSVATENGLILEVLKGFTKKMISGIDDVKDVLDKELDPAISALSVIVLNQDSFSYFNKLKDTQGRYLLEVDPKNSTQKLLSGRRVIVLSNRILKTTENKAPAIIGSLKEGVVLFDRQATSLKATDVGGEAFINDRTDIRAIMRMDVKKFDESAIVFGEIDLSTAGA